MLRITYWSKFTILKQQGNMIPLEPAYNFLFDKLRDGPNEKEARREKTRRHPRNYGGINFEDVPKKIQQERAKQVTFIDLPHCCQDLLTSNCFVVESEQSSTLLQVWRGRLYDGDNRKREEGNG